MNIKNKKYSLFIYGSVFLLVVLLSIPVSALAAQGDIDPSFNIGNGSLNVINTLALQADGKILIGGLFSSFDGNTSSNIARLNTDGSFDSTFATGLGFDGTVSSIAIQSDGKILVGGSFTSYDSSSAVHIARINTNGSADSSFLPTSYASGFNNDVSSIALQTDGQILVGGAFTQYIASSTSGMARLDSDGNLDENFNSNIASSLGSSVSAIAVQADGKILVGANNFTRLNADGTTDTAFATAIGTGFDSTIKSIVTQSDAKILVGGNFSAFDGVPNNHLVRLDVAGSLDTSFISPVELDSYVNSMTVQSDGKIYAVGGFNVHIIRLNSIGTVDTSFVTNSGFNNEARSIKLQSDGKVVVVGYFTNYNSIAQHNISRLLTSDIVTPVTVRKTRSSTGGGGGSSSYVGAITKASKYKQSDKYVLQLQQTLIKLKYASSTDIALDKGIFSTETEKAIKLFQAKFPKSLEMPVPTGKLDPRTIRKLNTLVAKLEHTNNPKNPSIKFSRFITTIGTIGLDVTALQKFLNNNGFIVMTTGEGSLGKEGKYFGTATSAALKKWQMKQGIQGTGILDKQTMDRLNRI